MRCFRPGVRPLAENKPWGAMDPNSSHQLFSEWIFTVHEGGGRHVPMADVQSNVTRWLRHGFGSVAQAKVEEKLAVRVGLSFRYYQIMCHVEGVPAHDESYVVYVRREFAKWVEKGWGPIATSTVTVRVLAGDSQDGTPRSQLVVMPRTLLP